MTASGGAGEESEMLGESAAGTRRATNAVASPARPLRGDAPAATALPRSPTWRIASVGPPCTINAGLKCAPASLHPFPSEGFW